MLPNFSHARYIPATDPGTPTDLMPVLLIPLTTFPSQSRYILSKAFEGAFSLKSIKEVSPVASLRSKNPPPPIFPADGCVTARAKETAIAASMAFPPFFSTVLPASVASEEEVETIAPLE